MRDSENDLYVFSFFCPMLIRHKLLQTITAHEILEQTKSALELTIGSELGEGRFGKVYQGTAQVALKIPKERGRSDFINEVKILSCLNHQNIVAFLGNKKGAMVMERMDENLHQLIKRKGGSLRIDSIMRFGLGLAYGLEYLQQLGILHLDLKSKNILINNNPEIAKLSDFGLSKVLTEDNVGHEVLHYDGQVYDSNSIFPESLKVSKSGIFLPCVNFLLSGFVTGLLELNACFHTLLKL